MSTRDWTPYERTQEAAIRAWKAEPPSIASKVVGFVATPLTWLVRIVIPDAAVRGALDCSNTVAHFLTDVDDIKKAAGVESLAELHSLELEKLDQIANSVHNWAVGLASGEGGVTGTLGLPGLLADVPSIITLALRTIHKIGACYGYELTNEHDAQFVYGILSASSSNTMKEKAASIVTLQSLRIILERQTWKAMAEKAATQQFGKEAALLSLRALAKQVGINLTKRKAMQAIPLVGLAVGATANGWWVKDVGWSARRSFQERWLADHGKAISP